jgi:hypothetical protein
VTIASAGCSAPACVLGVRAVTSGRERERLQAEVYYHRDRIALLRAKLYRWGVGSSARLEELERELARAERRLADGRPARSDTP